MANMDFEDIVRRVLRSADDHEEFDPRSLGLEFEKGGDASFDVVIRALADSTTTEGGRIRALQMLALLSRQFCVARKPEVIDVAIGLMADPARRVRSAAVNVAVFETANMLRLGAFSKNTVEVTLLRVKEALATALGRGLAPEQGELARRFIASNGTFLDAGHEE